MQIHPNIKIIDLALYLNNHKTLVLADFHIGYEEALNKQGTMIPRFQFKNIILRLEKIFKQVQPETIIINGDIKHEFGTISNQEWRETLKLLEFLKRKCKKLILIKGNHDTILGPIADKKDIKIVDNYKIDNILITHGHKLEKTNSNILIIAHEHPAIGLKEGARIEKYKAFLKGKPKNQTIIIQPSFNLVTEGTDILREDILSPFLKQDLDNFEIFVVDEEIMGFGRLKELK